MQYANHTWITETYKHLNYITFLFVCFFACAAVWDAFPIGCYTSSVAGLIPLAAISSRSRLPLLIVWRRASVAIYLQYKRAKKHESEKKRGNSINVTTSGRRLYHW